MISLFYAIYTVNYTTDVPVITEADLSCTVPEVVLSQPEVDSIWVNIQDKVHGTMRVVERSIDSLLPPSRSRFVNSTVPEKLRQSVKDIYSKLTPSERDLHLDADQVLLMFEHAEDTHSARVHYRSLVHYISTLISAGNATHRDYALESDLIEDMNPDHVNKFIYNLQTQLLSSLVSDLSSDDTVPQAMTRDMWFMLEALFDEPSVVKRKVREWMHLTKWSGTESVDQLWERLNAPKCPQIGYRPQSGGTD